MTLGVVLIVCEEHYAVAQRAASLVALGLDRRVMLLKLPPKEERSLGGGCQEVLWSCVVCDWERLDLVDPMWTQDPWWQR